MGSFMSQIHVVTQSDVVVVTAQWVTSAPCSAFLMESILCGRQSSKGAFSLSISTWPLRMKALGWMDQLLGNKRSRMARVLSKWKREVWGGKGRMMPWGPEVRNRGSLGSRFCGFLKTRFVVRPFLPSYFFQLYKNGLVLRKKNTMWSRVKKRRRALPLPPHSTEQIRPRLMSVTAL